MNGRAEDNNAGPNHGHDDITFTPWNDTGTLPAVTGNYCLNADVDLSSTVWTVPEGADVGLCLNGHTVKAPVSCITAAGRLRLYDCGTAGKLEMTNPNNIYLPTLADAPWLIHVTGELELYSGTISQPLGGVDAGYAGGSGRVKNCRGHH